jgi:hypothetical protein
LWSWTPLKPLRPGLCPFSRQAVPTCIYDHNGNYGQKWFLFLLLPCIVSFIMLKIMQWLWTAHFSWTNQVCGITI